MFVYGKFSCVQTTGVKISVIYINIYIPEICTPEMCTQYIYLYICIYIGCTNIRVYKSPVYVYNADLYPGYLYTRKGVHQ